VRRSPAAALGGGALSGADAPEADEIAGLWDKSRMVEAHGRSAGDTGAGHRLDAPKRISLDASYLLLARDPQLMAVPPRRLKMHLQLRQKTHRLSHLWIVDGKMLDRLAE
jgi:hypothetical protein